MAFFCTCPVLLLSVVDDSVRDFLGDFTALDFVVLAMIDKIDVRNEEGGDNKRRKDKGRNMKERLTNT